MNLFRNLAIDVLRLVELRRTTARRICLLTTIQTCRMPCLSAPLCSRPRRREGLRSEGQTQTQSRWGTCLPNFGTLVQPVETCKQAAPPRSQKQRRTNQGKQRSAHCCQRLQGCHLQNDHARVMPYTRRSRVTRTKNSHATRCTPNSPKHYK